MIRTFKILFLLINTILLLACEKENRYTDNESSQEQIVLNATIESAITTRVGFTDTSSDGVKVWWQKGATDSDYSDSFSVYNTTTGVYVGDFIYTGSNGANAGSFIQATEFSLPDGDYTAVFPAVDGTTYATLALRDAMQLDDVDGMLYDDLKHLNKASRMRADFSYSSTDTQTQVKFNNELTMIKLSFNSSFWQRPTFIAVNDGSSTVTYNFDSDIDISTQTYFEAYILIEPQIEGTTLNISVNFDGGTTDTLNKHTIQLTQDLYAGKRYNINIGEFNDIIPIYTVADLQNINTNLNGNYILMNDIDLSSVSSWVPIGSSSSNFIGSFNGNGHTISNLTITSGDYVGLFGYVVDASIYNLTISSANIAGLDYAGGLVGLVSNTKIWDIIMQDVVVSGYGSVGGIVGSVNSRSTIRNCSVGGTVNGNNNVGGVAGALLSGSLAINCTSSVNFINSTNDRTYYIGGVVGASTSSTIVACAYTGSINVNYMNSIYGAGVVGIAQSTKIVACYNIGVVNYRSTIAGILASSNNSSNTIYGCYNTATLNYDYERENQNGGIVGDNYPTVMCSGNFWLDQSGDDVTQPAGGSDTYSGITIFTTHSSLVLPSTIAEMNQAIEESGVKGVRYVAGISYPELKVDASVTIN